MTLALVVHKFVFESFLEEKDGAIKESLAEVDLEGFQEQLVTIQQYLESFQTAKPEMLGSPVVLQSQINDLKTAMRNLREDRRTQQIVYGTLAATLLGELLAGVFVLASIILRFL